MRLIKCPECGNEISTNAKSCPKCGCEITVCPDCGTVYAGKTTLCKNCGYKFKTSYENIVKDDRVLKKAEQFVKINKIFGIISKVAGLVGFAFIIAGVILLNRWQISDPLEQLENYKSTMNLSHTFAVIFIVFTSIGDICFIFNCCDLYNINQILFLRFVNENNIDCFQYCKQNINLIKNKNNIKTYRFITASAYFLKNTKAHKISYFIVIIACILYLLSIIFLANFIFGCIDTFEYNVFYELEIKFTSFNYIPLIVYFIFIILAMVGYGIFQDRTKKNIDKWLIANSLPVNIG